MQLAISSSDDLVELYGRYIELVERDVEDTLELVFAPGDYGVASIGPIQLDLGGNPAPRDPKLDVTIRGQAGAPAVFRDLGVLVNARSLHLEHVIFTGRRQAVLQARVARLFSMRSCVVADNSWGGPWNGALLQVGGVFGHDAYRVSIDDTWFVRNTEESSSTLLDLGPASGAFVDEIKLARVAFLDNRTHRDLAIREAQAIQIADLIAVKQEPGVVIHRTNVERTEIEHSTFVVSGPGAIAGADTRVYSSALTLRDTTVYLPGGGKLPDDVRGARVRDRASLRPGAEPFADLVARVAAGTLAPHDAWSRLEDSLGLTS
ncbi:MAG: hypothetical protein WKG01_24285 [Kofleriaceae bacterium]